jgi:hypothetical protein
LANSPPNKGEYKTEYSLFIFIICARFGRQKKGKKKEKKERLAWVRCIDMA